MNDQPLPADHPFVRDLAPRAANRVPLTPVSFLERAADVWADRIAVRHGRLAFTYRDFGERARRLASALARRGIGRGDTVAVMAPNVPALLELHYAVPALGAVLNALNVRLDAAALAFCLGHGEAKVLVTDPEFAPVMRDALARLRRDVLVVDIDDPEGPGGHEAFIEDVGALVMGRTTYDWVRAHMARTGEPWAYAAPTWVMTHRDPDPVEGADIRFIHPEAVMSVLEIRWGLIPDMTGTQVLPRLVGLDVAKELTFTGRMVPGTECVEIGLATHLSDDPRADALALAREIATKSPDAIRQGKRLLSQSGQVTVAEQFADEARTMASLIGSPNQVEAVTAYFEKRDPVFED